MQNIVIDKPYAFIPPNYSRFWHSVARLVAPRTLRKTYGIVSGECVGADKLRDSIASGHGVLLAANHCRPCDPLVLDYLSREVARPFHVMASWHVFMNDGVQRFLLPRIGGFSVYREGLDRESLKCATRLMVEGRFPLVIFPEGLVTRTNDRLVNFMEGPAFLARSAAKQRAGGKVVIHPVFLRYFFEGDLRRSVTPVVESIERRLSWQMQEQLSLPERITKAGHALLALKEIEYLGHVGEGDVRQRLQRLVDHLLVPLEQQWTGGRKDEETMARVKRLRTAILPDIVSGDLGEDALASRWRQLADLYLVQQLHCYPGNYLATPTPERVLETVERYEEDLTDTARPHAPLHAVIMVGDAIEVSPARDRSHGADPVTSRMREQMETLLEDSTKRRRVSPANAELL